MLYIVGLEYALCVVEMKKNLNHNGAFYHLMMISESGLLFWDPFIGLSSNAKLQLWGHDSNRSTQVMSYSKMAGNFLHKLVMANS